MRVLIADDDPLNRDFLKQLLLSHGYAVLVAEDGHAALQLLKQRSAPQIALLDWEMPRMTGLELCRAIRQEIMDRYVHVLLISGVHPDEHRIAALEAGADDFLPKPYHPELLLARLRVASRLVDGQLSTSERLLAALREAEATPGGDVAVREGDTVGYITFCQGRVSWAYVSHDTSSFFVQLGKELNMNQGSVDSVLQSCRDKGTDFYYELIERGHASEAELRSAIGAWLRRKLEQICRLAKADVMFLPADRTEEPVYTFSLETVLPRQLLAELGLVGQTRNGMIAKPSQVSPPSSERTEWERVFVPVSDLAKQRFASILQSMQQIPGCLGTALLDMRHNRSFGIHGLLPQVSVLLKELWLLRSLHRPGMPLDLSVNQGGLYHLLVAPPFETSLVLVLVIDGSKGLFGTARIRLTQIASDLQMIEDSSDHLIPIKLE